jgi:cytochrome c oxidase assembly protein subunit 11
MATAVDPRRNRRTALSMAIFAAGMLGLGYAAVPLYDLFCRVTGFGGTTQQASEAKAATIKVLDQKISIRFDGNVDRGMPWTFGPEQVTQDVRIGQRAMAFYKARNDSDKPVTGVASFNVAPDVAGKYFNKVHCFCFNQQTLAPGQEVDMPVQYYVDPAILSDPDAKGIEQITLSYTFHVSADQATKPLDRGDTAR